jgi:hypothetical protein
MSGIAHLRRRIRLRLIFARDTWCLCQRILLGRAVPMSHHLTGHVGIATSLVIRLIIVVILPSRILRETSVRGVFIILLRRKFLLVKWSLLVNFLLMIIL